MESILQQMSSVVEYAEVLLGVNPIYMLPVFMIVAIISKPLKLRERFPQAKNLLLGVMAFLVGILVVFLFDDYPTWRIYVKSGFILGSTSALTYQVFKPVIKALIEKLFDRVNQKIGSEIEDDDLLV